MVDKNFSVHRWEILVGEKLALDEALDDPFRPHNLNDWKESIICEMVLNSLSNCIEKSICDFPFKIQI